MPCRAGERLDWAGARALGLRGSLEEGGVLSPSPFSFRSECKGGMEGFLPQEWL